MDAITHLIKEHDQHRHLFEMAGADRSHYPRLRAELVHHVNEEEEILYSHLLELGIGEAEIRKAWEEHKLIMQLLQELDSVSDDEKAWQAKFQTLKTLHLHHIDEEEKLLFPQINQSLSDKKLSKLAAEMREIKESKDTNQILYPEKPGSNQQPPL